MEYSFHKDLIILRAVVINRKTKNMKTSKKSGIPACVNNTLGRLISDKLIIYINQTQKKNRKRIGKIAVNMLSVNE